MKTIETHPNYSVTADGQVISTYNTNPRRGPVGPQYKPLKQVPDGQGFLKVNLWKDGSPTTASVQQLVAEAFIGPKPEGHEVSHRNGDKTDNRVGNLYYTSIKANARRAEKLLATEVVIIRSLKGEMTVPQIAALFGVSKRHVTSILANAYRKQPA